MMMKWWLAHRILMNEKHQQVLTEDTCDTSKYVLSGFRCASLMGEKDGYHTSMAPAWQTECYFKIVTIFILQHNPNLKRQYQVVANVKIKNSKCFNMLNWLPIFSSQSWGLKKKGGKMQVWLAFFNTGLRLGIWTENILQITASIC